MREFHFDKIGKNIAAVPGADDADNSGDLALSSVILKIGADNACSHTHGDEHYLIFTCLRKNGIIYESIERFGILISIGKRGVIEAVNIIFANLADNILAGNGPEEIIPLLLGILRERIGHPRGNDYGRKLAVFIDGIISEKDLNDIVNSTFADKIMIGNGG